MGAAVALGNVVGEAQHVLVVAVVPPQGTFHREAILFAADHDGIRDCRLLGAVEIADEGLDAAFVIKLHILGLDAALVAQQNAHAGIEEGEFAQAMLDGGEIEFGFGEGCGAWQEGDFGAALAFGGSPSVCKRPIGIAIGEAHGMILAVAVDA